jgi:hypothetical protein
VKQFADRDRLAREVDRASGALGQTAGDTSRLMAAGIDPAMAAKFQGTLAGPSKEQGALLKSMGLDSAALASKPLAQSLSAVGAGLNAIQNPADRVNAAMTLFGRNGHEVLGTLTNLSQKLQNTPAGQLITADDIARVKAWDSALKGAGESLSRVMLAAGRKVGAESGIGTHLARGVEGIGHAMRWDWQAFDKAEARWNKEDKAAATAERTAAAAQHQARLAAEAERYATAMKWANDSLDGLTDKLADLRHGDGTAARNAFMREAREKGLDKQPGGMARVMQQYDAIDQEIDARQRRKQQEADRDNRLKGIRSPADVLHAEYSAIDSLRDAQLLSANQVAELKKRHLEDYYRTAHGLDRKQLAEELRSPAQKYQQHMQALEAMRRGTRGDDPFGLNPALQARARDKLRGELGVRDSMGDYAKQFRDLKEARDKGLITGEQFDIRRRELRRTAVEGATSHLETVSPIGAMARGSAEAYSMLVQSQLNDPKAQLQQQANAKLDAIERNTRANRAVTPETVLDF